MLPDVLRSRLWLAWTTLREVNVVRVAPMTAVDEITRQKLKTLRTVSWLWEGIRRPTFTSDP